jgi:hypothetical protein
MSTLQQDVMGNPILIEESGGYVLGVSDVSIADVLRSTPDTSSGVTLGNLNTAAYQDVPRGPSAGRTTDGTATTADHAASPGTLSLLWNSITGRGPGLFSCRPDSWLCVGSGQAATSAPTVSGTNGITLGFGGTLALVIVGLFLVFLVFRKVSA